MRQVALATCSALPEGWADDRLLAEALRRRGVAARFEAWDDPRVAWGELDMVVIRSTWDYTRRREDFLAWADTVGGKLRNPPAVLRWNSDKRYLADLEAAGLPVVPTAFVGPGHPPPRFESEVVVKPTVSAGARDTGRFGPSAYGEAAALVRQLVECGRTAMVQPYLRAVDEAGETAIVFLSGRESHVLRKRAVLGPDEVAPVREDPIGAAEVMYDEGLVCPGSAGEAERALAGRIVKWLRQRFGAAPLYARVDLVPRADGAPLLLELEVVEPCLYFASAAGSAERMAEAVLSSD